MAETNEGMPLSLDLYEGDSFDGPLDLLLYLIKRNEVDINNIPVSLITEQYLEHLRLMEPLDLDTAGDFLVMAATLAQIKSRLLLPVTGEEGEGGEPAEDPRMQLVRPLLEYARYQAAAEALAGRYVLNRDVFPRGACDDFGDDPAAGEEAPLLVSLIGLVEAWRGLAVKAKRVHRGLNYSIETMTIGQKLRAVRAHLVKARSAHFLDLLGCGPPELETSAGDGIAPAAGEGPHADGSAPDAETGRPAAAGAEALRAPAAPGSADSTITAVYAGAAGGSGAPAGEGAMDTATQDTLDNPDAAENPDTPYSTDTMDGACSQDTWRGEAPPDAGDEEDAPDPREDPPAPPPEGLPDTEGGILARPGILEFTPPPRHRPETAAGGGDPRLDTIPDFPRPPDRPINDPLDAALSFLAVLELARTGFLRMWQDTETDASGPRLFLADPDAEAKEDLDYR
ncbi:MAG: segregation/condensation protein A [Deltaproteobacteria bacterium]|jgi:segregation and condensation protein A|nr:segregation/condensation protein A [Deltaproteobacteria bacterium]